MCKRKNNQKSHKQKYSKCTHDDRQTRVTVRKSFNHLTPTVAMVTAVKHPVPDRVKPSFVIFDIRAL